MYGKFFASAFTGSMMGAGSDVFAVWAYVIANTVNGAVELNPRLLSAVIGIPEDRAASAIETLCSPDPRSRSKTADGRRLLRDGEYMYSVPNHAVYRAIRSEDDRRAYNRQKQAEHRARAKAKQPVKTTVNDNQSQSSMSAQSEIRDQKQKTDTDQTLRGGALTRALVAAFCERWRAKYGSAYLVQKKDVGAVERLKLAIEPWCAMVDRYLADSTPFHVNRRHPLEHLANNPNEFTGPKNATGKPVRDVRGGHAPAVVSDRPSGEVKL